MLLVVTADHGEAFGEHGIYAEHWSISDDTQRIPLMFKPSTKETVESGPRDHLVTNVDVARMLVDYAGIEPHPVWQGRSLRSVIEDSGEGGRDAIVFDHRQYAAQRVVRTGRWKLVRTYHRGLWEDVVPERQRFDLETDS